MEILLLLALLVSLIYFYNWYATKQRRKRMMTKYNDPVIVDRIMSKSFWIDQTEEQLLDSLGKPADIDSKVMKTKSREVWKYNQRTKTIYGLKITLENGTVAGWDIK